MDKLKIKGLGNMELVDSIPEKGKEYLISIVAERDGQRIDEKDPDSILNIYEMSYLRTEAIQEIGTAKKIKVQNGKTKSQKLRFILRDLAAMLGKEEDIFYDECMDKIILHYQEKLK